MRLQFSFKKYLFHVFLFLKDPKYFENIYSSVRALSILTIMPVEEVYEF